MGASAPRHLGSLGDRGAKPVASCDGVSDNPKKYEFTPETIRVSVGNHVKLVITAEDHTHGFKLEAMRINEKVEKGKPVTVEFTPTEAGTFPFECSHFCGLGHKKMKGQLIVE